MEIEYATGDIVPVTSPLYRVVHEPPESSERFQTFYAGDDFPACPGCGEKVRYKLPTEILSKGIEA